jgi:hypothetical protein
MNLLTRTGREHTLARALAPEPSYRQIATTTATTFTNVRAAIAQVRWRIVASLRLDSRS